MPRPWLLLALTACRLAPPPSFARVHHGPAYGTQLTTLVAMPADPAMCTPGQCGAVATATRMSLELAGYTIVDAELLNAELRRRTVHTTTSQSRPHAAVAPPFAPPSSDTSSRTEVEGITFQQVPPEDRAALVREVGAEGVLETQVLSAPGKHVWLTTYTIAVTLRTLDGRVVWNSACSDESGDLNDVRQAIEAATRCALESVALW